MLARTRRRRWLWSLGAASAAAAVLLIWQVVGVSRAHQPSAEVTPLGRGATLRVGEEALPLTAQTAVTSGSTIETANDGGAALQLATRSSLLLSGASALRLQENGQTERFALKRGGFSAHVAKLTGGRRFIVETPDAEIEVRGTRFLLRVLERPQGCGAGSRTRLEVSEGIVEVRSLGLTARVGAGESWPVDCAALEPLTPREVTLETPAVPAGSAAAMASKAAARPAPAASTPAGPSGLSRQNDLFAAGVALRRQGDAAGALRVYQDLITQFPNSPLAENAMVERMRLLSASQRSLAVEEAQRYLRRYPRGFGRDEALRLTEKP